ncbi:hypothetical protein Tco_0309380 [Tanacetum coccineum]
MLVTCLSSGIVLSLWQLSLGGKRWCSYPVGFPFASCSDFQISMYQLSQSELIDVGQTFMTYGSDLKLSVRATYRASFKASGTTLALPGMERISQSLVNSSSIQRRCLHYTTKFSAPSGKARIGAEHNFCFKVWNASSSSVPHSYFLFLAQVTEKESSKKQLQDVSVIRNFPEVFPDDLPGLPPPQQVEFRIELVPGAAPVAHFHSDASSILLRDSPLSDHSSPDLPSTSAGPSRKRRRSPMASVPALPPVSGALSPVRADLISSPKRVRDFGYSENVEVVPLE